MLQSFQKFDKDSSTQEEKVLRMMEQTNKAIKVLLEQSREIKGVAETAAVNSVSYIEENKYLVDLTRQLSSKIVRLEKDLKALSGGQNGMTAAGQVSLERTREINRELTAQLMAKNIKNEELEEHNTCLQLRLIEANKKLSASSRVTSLVTPPGTPSPSSSSTTTGAPAIPVENLANDQ